MQLYKCFLCDTSFEGKTTAKLINHVNEVHRLIFEDYIIQSQYAGKAPKCACGLCDAKPFFSRGIYSKYAFGHEKFKTKEELYIKKYGEPICLHCKKYVNFYRGEPRQYCSHTCAGLHVGGFLQKKTQDKIKKNMLEKYGVENVMYIAGVQEKKSAQQSGENNSFYGSKHNEKTLQTMSDSSQKMWLDPKHRALVIPKFSALRKRNWQDPIYRKTILQGNLSGKHSKLHQKISEYLGLKELKFESERVIFRYRVDEVNFEKKIIVEINGDHIHANPNKFKADDLIIVRKSQYTAQDKWNYDQKRKEALEALGFKVFVVWQSDDLNEKNNELLQLLGE